MVCPVFKLSWINPVVLHTVPECVSYKVNSTENHLALVSEPPRRGLLSFWISSYKSATQCKCSTNIGIQVHSEKNSMLAIFYFTLKGTICNPNKRKNKCTQAMEIILIIAMNRGNYIKYFLSILVNREVLQHFIFLEYNRCTI